MSGMMPPRVRPAVTIQRTKGTEACQDCCGLIGFVAAGWRGSRQPGKKPARLRASLPTFFSESSALRTLPSLVSSLFCGTVFGSSCATTDDLAQLPRLSDHFDGTQFFNPPENIPADMPDSQSRGERARRGGNWLLGWVFGHGWEEWPEFVELPTAKPAARISDGTIRVVPIGHAAFLIQMDGLNILTDPVWAERVSPIPFLGPRRHKSPGIRFEDLPPIDVVLISHNHYDHLDLDTLERLSSHLGIRAVVPLGNKDLVQESGLTQVDELDWWESVRVADGVTVTAVPAQHFSSRTLWDRNRTLWAGFVVSSAAGIVYFAGDTGYGLHFRRIAERFPSIDVALLPVAPFHEAASPRRRNSIHTNPEEAVQAHLDLQARTSIAGHFQVFQLGAEGFGDGPQEVAKAMARHGVASEAFVIPEPGQEIRIGQTLAKAASEQ